MACDLSGLTDPDAGKRGIAAFKLGDSFDEDVGDSLVNMLITEKHPVAFKLAVEGALPKWIVKLERSLAICDAWPINPMNTACLVERVRGMRLPSYERHLLSLFATNDWVYKLAAVAYCREKQIQIEAARSVCDHFLRQREASGLERAYTAQALGLQSEKQLIALVRRMRRDLR